jgi:hypothetical protein
MNRRHEVLDVKIMEGLHESSTPSVGDLSSAVRTHSARPNSSLQTAQPEDLNMFIGPSSFTQSPFPR